MGNSTETQEILDEWKINGTVSNKTMGSLTDYVIKYEPEEKVDAIFYEWNKTNYTSVLPFEQNTSYNYTPLLNIKNAHGELVTINLNQIFGDNFIAGNDEDLNFTLRYTYNNTNYEKSELFTITVLPPFPVPPHSLCFVK